MRSHAAQDAGPERGVECIVFEEVALLDDEEGVVFSSRFGERVDERG